MDKHAHLLAPCNRCDSITDKETGYLIGPSVMLFKTYNGSSRYVYQVGGRSVAVLLIDSHSRHLGRVVSVYSLPDYRNTEFFRVLYMVASKDFNHIRLGPELEDNPQAMDLVNAIRLI